MKSEIENAIKQLLVDMAAYHDATDKMKVAQAVLNLAQARAAIQVGDA